MEDTIKDINDLLNLAKELPPVEEGEFKKLPDGKYIAIIDKAGFGTSKKGNLQFVWEFIITEGPHTKSHEWKYSSLTSEVNMQYLVGDLKKFGVNTESYESIEKDLELLLDVPVQLDIVSTPSKKDPNAEPFRNVYVKPCNS